MKFNSLLATIALLVCVAATTVTDGATITNSGSTNAVGWVIAVHSDGRATLTINQRGGEANPTPFAVDSALAQRFLAEAKAAHDSGSAPLRSCMKSMSFGSSTHVGYHGYVSPDFKCPVMPEYSALAADAGQIQQASGVSSSALGLHRIPLMPGENRRSPIVESTPTVAPIATP